MINFIFPTPSRKNSNFKCWAWSRVPNWKSRYLVSSYSIWQIVRLILSSFLLLVLILCACTCLCIFVFLYVHVCVRLSACVFVCVPKIAFTTMSCIMILGLESKGLLYLWGPLIGATNRDAQIMESVCVCVCALTCWRMCMCVHLAYYVHCFAWAFHFH